MSDRIDVDTAGLQVSPHPEPDVHGWVLGGRYEVLDSLGRGGMAEVFRAHDQLLDRDVAVKVFRTAVDPADGTHGEVRRELELQSLAQLSHPNLITLFDGSIAGDGPAYLVLELVNGPDLATRLAAGALPEPLVRQIGRQIADALGYVHARGMVHRDVKPANILLGADDMGGGLGAPSGFDGPRGTGGFGAPAGAGELGAESVRARLSDFGIVRMIGSDRMTSVDLTLGTASYIAPEQARGENVGPAADVYSLGLVLIEALTGVRVFDGPIHEALAARLTNSPRIPDGLPQPWPGLLAAMTAREPGQRPSAVDVARSLRETAAATGAVVASPFAMDDAMTAPISPLGVGAGMSAGVGLAAAGAGMGLASADARTAATAAATAAASDLNSAHHPLRSGSHTVRRPRRRNTGYVLAALVAAALLGGGGFMLISGAGQPSSQTGPSSSVPAVSTSAGRHASTTHAAVVGQTRAATHPNSAPPSTHNATTRNAAPATTAPRAHSTSAAVTTSAPAPSATAAATSSAAAAAGTTTAAPAGP